MGSSRDKRPPQKVILCSLGLGLPVSFLSCHLSHNFRSLIMAAQAEQPRCGRTQTLSVNEPVKPTHLSPATAERLQFPPHSVTWHALHLGSVLQCMAPHGHSYHCILPPSSLLELLHPREESYPWTSGPLLQEDVKGIFIRPALRRQDE